MKIKILAAPVLIVLIVIMAIWVISPAYRDFRAKKAELEKAQTKLTAIQEKNSRAAQLGQSLATKTDQKTALLRYIPEQQKEEDVIANLNALAGTAGLSVYNISIGNVEKRNAAADTAAQPSGNFLLPPVIETADLGDMVVAPAKPEARNFKVTLGVAGSYGKIKDLLGKIAALQRFNSIASLKIAKAQAQSVAEGTSADSGTSDNLQADISLNFNFIDKSDAIVNLDNEIFAGVNFDMTVIDNIKSQMTTVVNSLTAVTSGVQNPFVK
ncbi:MAG: hypothetical protein WC238_05500 [Parcubacteria group bacterium]|jgi:Tfp pilus assembly protein PilO